MSKNPENGNAAGSGSEAGPNEVVIVYGEQLALEGVKHSTSFGSRIPAREEADPAVVQHQTPEDILRLRETNRRLYE